MSQLLELEHRPTEGKLEIFIGNAKVEFKKWFFFLNLIFCPKTAIVSKMCKDQDLGRVQKYSVPIKKGKKIFCWSKYACMLCTSTMAGGGAPNDLWQFWWFYYWLLNILWWFSVQKSTLTLLTLANSWVIVGPSIAKHNFGF